MSSSAGMCWCPGQPNWARNPSRAAATKFSLAVSNSITLRMSG